MTTLTESSDTATDTAADTAAAQRQTQATRAVATAWFDALGAGDIEAATALLDPHVSFVNYHVEPGWNDAMPWIGTFEGPEAVRDSFGVFVSVCEVLSEELLSLVVDGEHAHGVLAERSRVRATGAEFDIRFVQALVVRNDKIVSWTSYTDPSPILRALRAPRGADQSAGSVLDATRTGDVPRLIAGLHAGADPDVRDSQTGLTALMIAAGRGDVASVRALLDAGADPRAVDPAAGASVLHKACQGGDVDVVRMLLDAGAFVDTVAPTTGHTPLMDALWFKFPDVVECLLDAGAGLELHTHYGFSLREHFAYELSVNTIGKDRLLRADELITRRTASDDAAVAEQVLMAATASGDTAAASSALAAGADVDARAPRRNGFNDAHTPLLVAARDGHLDIVRLLLDAGADVNATEPTFGAVPLHKAVYNGHADITAELLSRDGVDLDFQGATNGYSPLHDALWHGYADCARLLVEAGAALHTVGHDGKRPLDLAVEVFGESDELTALIRHRVERPDS